MKLGGIYMSVGVKTDQYKRDLAKAQTLTGKAAVTIQKRISSINFKLVGLAALAFAGTFALAMKKSIDAASDLEETTGKFNVVFQDHIKQAEAMSKELVNSYAMSTREAKQYLSSVQDLLVPMGMVSDKAILMSNEVVKLAADLGSFNNLPTKTVMLDIQSALVGNFETMKKYGVVLNETVIKQAALNAGLWDGKGMVDANTKAQIAYKLMLKGSAAALGDQQRTMGSYANQIKQFDANIEDLKATIGNELLPEATKIVNTINNWIKENDSLIKQDVPKYIDKIKTSFENIWNIISYDPAILEWGIVGLAFGGKKGAVVMGAMGHMASWASNLSKALGLAAGGVVEFSEVATANFKELEDIVKRFDNYQIDQSGFLFKVPAIPKQEVPLETVIMPSQAPDVDLKSVEALRQARLNGFKEEERMRSEKWQAEIEFSNAQIEKEREAQESRQLIVAEANQVFAEIGMSRFDIERAEVERMTEIYRQAGVDRNQIEKIASDKNLKIAQAEQQAKLSIYQNIAGGIAGTFQQIAQAGGKQSKEAFKMYKAFAMVEASISGYKAVLQAMASYPPPISFVMAGIAGAAAAVQIGMIASSQPPSYDQGGISSARGIYQTGDIQEAHIPIPSGGKIPVKVEENQSQKPMQIIMNNPVFQDVATQRQVFAEIAETVARQVAPGAVVENYNNDGPVRSMIRGGI